MHPLVEECYQQIADAEAKLRQFRASCQHEKFIVGLWSYGPGRTYPSRICDECGLPILGITPEEMLSVGVGVPGTTVFQNGISVGETI